MTLFFRESSFFLARVSFNCFGRNLKVFVFFFMCKKTMVSHATYIVTRKSYEGRGHFFLNFSQNEISSIIARTSLKTEHCPLPESGGGGLGLGGNWALASIFTTLRTSFSPRASMSQQRLHRGEGEGRVASPGLLSQQPFFWLSKARPPEVVN